MGNREVFASLKRSSRPNLLRKRFKAKPVPTVLLSAGRVPFKQQGPEHNMSSGAGQAEMGGAVFAKEIYEVGIPDSAEAQDDLVALAENAMDLVDREPDNTDKPQEQKHLHSSVEDPQFTGADKGVPVAPVGRAVVMADKLPQQKTISSKIMRLKSRVRAFLGTSKARVFSGFHRVGCGFGRCEVESEGVGAIRTSEATEGEDYGLSGSGDFGGSDSDQGDAGPLSAVCDDESAAGVTMETSLVSNGGGAAVDESLLSDSSSYPSYRSFHTQCSRFGRAENQGPNAVDTQPDMDGLDVGESLGYCDGSNGVDMEHQHPDDSCAEEQVVPWQEVMRRVEARRKRERSWEYAREKRERSQRYYSAVGSRPDMIEYNHHGVHGHHPALPTTIRRQFPESYAGIVKNPIECGAGLRWLTDEEIPVVDESTLGIGYEPKAGAGLLDGSNRRFKQLFNGYRSMSNRKQVGQLQDRTTSSPKVAFPSVDNSDSDQNENYHPGAGQFFHELSQRIARIQEEAEQFVDGGGVMGVATGGLGHRWVEEEDIPVMEESQVDENEDSIIEHRLLAASR